MKIIKTTQEMKGFSKKKRDESLGFVATMGALHAGHKKLIEKSKEENDITVVSLFVNPTQFNEKKDFESYPIKTKEDLDFCRNLGVDVVFCPEAQEIYLGEKETLKITETKITQSLEGLARPGHFEGVLQVVLKLFLIVAPNKAYFGKKDYQQYLVIKRMAEVFFLDVKVIGVETYRDASGLPYSSRNLKLDKDQLKRAQEISKAFKETSTKEGLVQKTQAQVDYYGFIEGRTLMAHRVGDVRILESKEG